MYGKMLSFLRDYRTRAHYYNFSDAGDALSSRDLTVFGYCVARGMDYLTNKSVSTTFTVVRVILSVRTLFKQVKKRGFYQRLGYF